MANDCELRPQDLNKLSEAQIQSINTATKLAEAPATDAAATPAEAPTAEVTATPAETTEAIRRAIETQLLEHHSVE